MVMPSRAGLKKLVEGRAFGGVPKRILWFLTKILRSLKKSLTAFQVPKKRLGSSGVQLYFVLQSIGRTAMDGAAGTVPSIPRVSLRRWIRRFDSIWPSDGERALCAMIMKRLDALTPRQRQVLEGVIRGRLNKHIAVDLGIHEKTVKVHRMRVMSKMGVRSIAELVQLAARVGVAMEPKTQGLASTLSLIAQIEGGGRELYGLWRHFKP